jgi:hypothetical protein
MSGSRATRYTLWTRYPPAEMDDVLFPDRSFMVYYLTYHRALRNASLKPTGGRHV